MRIRSYGSKLSFEHRLDLHVRQRTLIFQKGSHARYALRQVNERCGCATRARIVEQSAHDPVDAGSLTTQVTQHA